MHRILCNILYSYCKKRSCALHTCETKCLFYPILCVRFASIYHVKIFERLTHYGNINLLSRMYALVIFKQEIKDSFLDTAFMLQPHQMPCPTRNKNNIEHMDIIFKTFSVSKNFESFIKPAFFNYLWRSKTE